MGPREHQGLSNRCVVRSTVEVDRSGGRGPKNGSDENRTQLIGGGGGGVGDETVGEFVRP